MANSVVTKRIVTDPRILMGKPVIKGTRIPVTAILGMLAEDATKQEVLDDYPDLRTQDIAATLSFAAQVADFEDLRVETEVTG